MRWINITPTYQMCKIPWKVKFRVSFSTWCSFEENRRC